MARYLFLLQLCFQTIVVSATPRPRDHRDALSHGIQWSPCKLEGSLPMMCGNLSVPLDYADPECTETLNLDLYKISASKETSRGSVLLNFGGPGEAGGTSMAALGAQLQAIEGGYHDLITFDPRGTGNTLAFSCYKTASERLIKSLANPVISGNASDTALGTLWATGENFADACYENAKKLGSLLGTAYVARDMMRIVDALGEDGLLNYWGFSYGTVLGATAAAMFPDRIERMVLDGVVNTQEYYAGLDVEMFKDTDKTFASILSACIAAPERCALARHNLTASELEDAMYDLMDTIKFHPIPVNGFLIDYSVVQSTMLYYLYTPDAYPQLAAYLDAVQTRNLTSFSEFQAGPPDLDALVGIKCADTKPRSSGLAPVLPVIHRQFEASRLGGAWAAHFTTKCRQWKFEARERYEGDFHVRTKNPVLLIGNTFDPVTPLVSARNVSQALEGSVVLQHDGHGHTSIAQASVCTSKAIKAYFKDGTMPEFGSVCEVDVPLFSNKKWEDVLASR